METENLKNNVERYFKLFSSKNLIGLESQFSDDVILRDWDVFAEGKEEVIRANKNIFDSANSINITLKEFYQEDKVAVCLIDIEINQSEVIKVIDVIKFNKEFKIKEISAYKQ